MKLKTLAFIGIVSIFATSCIKKNNDPEKFLKVKIDGNWVTYEQTLADISPNMTDPQKMDLTIYAGQPDNYISVGLRNIPEIAEGSYTTGNGGYTLFVSARQTESGTTSDYHSSFYFGPDPVPSYTLNITSLSNTEIRGTITGNFLPHMSEDEKLMLTEAEFVMELND